MAANLYRFLVLSLGLTLAMPAPGAAPERWSDQDIQRVLERHCGFEAGDPIRRYRGAIERFEIQGPLWLHKAGDSEVFGVILPTFLRLYLFAQSRGCDDATLEDARELAGNEVWVALWRTEDPPRPHQHLTTSDQEVRRPTRVRWRYEGAWRKPAWTQKRNKWLATWYSADWNDGQSLLAAFPDLERDGALHIDYEVSEKGRTTYDNRSHQLSLHDAKWWRVAFGEETP
ncbi:MAG: hypothetical protein AAGC60_19510 [Acidobacteriota bacterium]